MKTYKFSFTLLALFCLASQFSTAQSTEGATISLNLSSPYTVPGAVYIIKGETQVGKEPVKVKVKISSPANKVEAFDLATDKLGKYQTKITAKEPYGKYTITVTGADGKRSASKDILVVDPEGMQEAIEEEMAKMAATAQSGLTVANNLVKQLPPSAAKTEYEQKAQKVKVGLEQVTKKFKVASTDLSVVIGTISHYPPVFEQAQPYVTQLQEITIEAATSEKNFKDRVKQSEQEAAKCDAMNFIAEAAGFASLVLDFKAKIAKVMINLASDKALPGAVDRMKWGNTQGQEQENAKLKINTAQKTMVASALGLEELSGFVKTGLSLDLVQFCAKSLYGKFCEELRGPFSGDFRAEMDADPVKGMWNSYDMIMKGTLVLRYEKGGDSKKGFAVSGEFEGVYTKYEFWENFEQVEKVPKGMMLLMREKKVAIPIDPSSIPIPKFGKPAGELDINNDLGMIARQLLPGSFRIKVKGKVINDKITLEIDKGAITNATNVGQTNRLILVIAQPLLPIPVIRVFDFPMAPARAIFTVGLGETQELELKPVGGKTIATKQIENVRKLENGTIRLRTRLNIKIGS